MVGKKNTTIPSGIDTIEEQEPRVWYVSPVGASEWLALSSAERLLEVEYARWLAGDMLGTQPPCIVPREIRVAEVAHSVRGVIDHIPAPRSRQDESEGITWCARCGRVIAKDHKPEFVQRNYCHAMKVRGQA